MSRTVDGMKECSKCRKMKPATREYYTLNRGILDGLAYECKECRKEYRKAHKREIAEYREAHKEERSVYSREYDIAHREKKTVYNREYNEAHREERVAYYEIKKERGICSDCTNPSIPGLTRCKTHRQGEDPPHYEQGGRTIDSLLEKAGLETLHNADIPYHLYPYGKRSSPDTAVWNPRKAIKAFIEAGFVVWKGPENGGKAVYVEFKGHPRALHSIPEAVEKTAGEILLVSRQGQEAKRIEEWIDKHSKFGFVELERS